jgi:8-oxo-dGTP pyrophosphatase MutT (NUDIX family)
MKRFFIIILYNIAYRLNQLRRMVLRPLTLGVKIMLVRDGEVLLVRHTYLAGWFIPGGGVKRGETLEEAARREAWEELGAKLEEVTLFGVYSNSHSYRNEHIAVFICDSCTLSGKQDYEIAESAFFPLQNPPPDINHGAYNRLREYYQSLPDNKARTW